MKNKNTSKGYTPVEKGKSKYPDSEEGLYFNLKYFDNIQGQSFEDWEKEKILSKMMKSLKHCSDKSITSLLAEQSGKRFAIYGEFPPNSKFKIPQSLEDIKDELKWAKISLENKPRIIGHLINNVFYVVFLDKNHDFFPTEKK